MIVAILYVALDALDMLTAAGVFIALFFHIKKFLSILSALRCEASVYSGSIASLTFILPRDRKGHTDKKEVQYVAVCNGGSASFQ